MKSSERVLDVRISDIKSYDMALNNAIDICYKTAFLNMCHAVRNFIKVNVDPDATKEYLVRLVI